MSDEAFTPIEEAFFRAGAAESEQQPAETFADLDEGVRRRPFLRRLFSRKQTQR